ncbi:type II CRISPR RNA-guided endonuclease Cas9 [Psychroserpens sp. Hel_I_66]|uniref:type II CRISPR RNA-guided endonuclease Cas9 n=1 Tax=Psychroserpens sp. Hel_I_66 TaxID=1250004 RepID=UPI0006483F3C|nr:type II CRISPR RNA-guided endonuclease Cas9 [Psychroserpens sp. Hel_I_66]
MKRILGLDLGTTSIGWALVEESKNKEESNIIKLGVRVNPLTVDEKINFEGGKPITTNADRTLKRGARRNLDRYQLRRDFLIHELKKQNFITENTPLTEIGKDTTHQTIALRALAARKKVSLEDLSKILLGINKKRGYKSSRKSKDENDGVAIDGMVVAKILYDNKLMPGQYVFNLLTQEKKHIPDFYPSDLKTEFDAIWTKQKEYYPEILTQILYQDLKGKNKGQTWTICSKPFQIEGIKLEGNRNEQKIKRYELRKDGLSKKLSLEHLAIVFQEINNDIKGTSGYLGKISDRSKELYIDKLTVGEYLYNQIKKNPHTSLKNQVFYRQDYLDEFEQIWNTQAEFHPELSDELKAKIRDIIIFYQRPLKSQKGLLSFCLFESWQQEYFDEVKQTKRKRTIGQRVIPKSSPLFQEFKIWQNINNLEFKYFGNPKDGSDKDAASFKLDEEDRKLLFLEANLRGDLNETSVLKLLGLSTKEWKTNFKEGIKGNTTNEKLFNVYQEIATREGYGIDWKENSATEILEELKAVFPSIGIDASLLEFDGTLQGNTYSKQTSYELWHLLYSAGDDTVISEEDKLIYGNSDVSLKKKLHQKYGFEPVYAAMLANISFPNDYGNLSARAIRKILPYLQDGFNYYEACDKAGYNHSNSITSEENKKRELKERLEILGKNSLRNPVVEKILNQMIHVVNQICDTYGKPDEIRIELARDLKKSAKERLETTKYINSATKINLDIAKTIQQQFGFTPTKNDIVKYKLWNELAPRGHKSLFSDEQIKLQDLFSSKIDIEHILPKALIYDDSFSNKTLAYRHVNLKKANRTAIDFITQDKNTELENYIERVEGLYDKGKGPISRGKRDRLLKSAKDIKEGFIERDLRNSQYIAKKSRTMLLEVFKEVTPTTGRITDRLREDWGIINVLKELNLPKYRAIGLIEIEERKNDKKIEKIKDWTKRNDHRHHAMDALAVAFTTHNHIQYINNLNARRDETHDKHKTIQNIETLITQKFEDDKGNYKRKFIKPMPKFRSEAKRHLEDILVSFKTKNKVVTRNLNKTKKDGGFNTALELTPRGQLHEATIYGKSKAPKQKPTKINKNFSIGEVQQIIHFGQRELVLKHLSQFENDPKKAFDTKTLKNQPLAWNDEPLNEVLCFEDIFTIRKDVSPGLNIDKVVDLGIREILKQRKAKHNGNEKEAFSDLDKKPIWQNKGKGIAIKRVTITGVSNAEPLHYKNDHVGEVLLDELDKKIPVDYVSLGNNHHVAIYEDDKGKLQEKVVSLYEAVERVNQNLPIIAKGYNAHLNWKFKFTMKQNEMFIFPSKEFNLNEIDLINGINSSMISQCLFRVQSISTKDYRFRHHLETSSDNNLDFTYQRIRSPERLRDLIKVRLNHLGQIVQIGEY